MMNTILTGKDASVKHREVGQGEKQPCTRNVNGFADLSFKKLSRKVRRCLGEQQQNTPLVGVENTSTFAVAKAKETLSPSYVVRFTLHNILSATISMAEGAKINMLPTVESSCPQLGRQVWKVNRPLFIFSSYSITRSVTALQIHSTGECISGDSTWRKQVHLLVLMHSSGWEEHHAFSDSAISSLQPLYFYCRGYQTIMERSVFAFSPSGLPQAVARPMGSVCLAVGEKNTDLAAPVIIGDGYPMVSTQPENDAGENQEAQVGLAELFWKWREDEVR